MRQFGARHGAEMVDIVESVASVLLAIFVAHRLGATNINWAAFSGYMVMRGHAGDTVLRGSLRIVGTVAGGLLALLVTPAVLSSAPLRAVSLFIVCGISLYGALAGKRAYAWLFFGLTFAMVMLDMLAHPGESLSRFVETRILETAAGTLACVFVSLVSACTLRRRWPAKRASPVGSHGWDRHIARHAGQGAAAVALLPILGSLVPLGDLAQAAVTIMAVMLVPLGDIATSGLSAVSLRILHRLIGCMAGAALGGIALFAAHGDPVVLIAATIVGVAVGRHIESGMHGRPYVGTQFVLAVLITLVPDDYATATVEPGLMRLIGVVVGMAVIEPVLLLWHWFAPISAKASGAQGERE